MKKIWFLLLILLPVLTNAQDKAMAEFSKANAAYRSGDYVGAAGIYENVLKSGLQSGSLYYNLGNCYYKMGETAKAVLAYERAKKFMPDDEDLAFNLRIAYSGTVDKIEPVPQLFYQRWWTEFLNWMKPSSWAWWSVLFLWLAAALSIGYLYARSISSRKLTFLSSGILLISATLLFVIAGCSYNAIHKQESAVIMQASITVHSSPDEKSTKLFILHAGTKIQVTDELGGWKQIRIANGNSGWVQEQSLEMI